MSCVAYVPDRPGDDKYGQCKKTKGTKKLPLFGNEWERGFGTKKVASAERPGSGLDSAWHLLSGRAGWARRESHVGGGVGRAPPWRQLRTDRKSQVSWGTREGRRRMSQRRVCEGAIR